jgi:hypothetical protein
VSLCANTNQIEDRQLKQMLMTRARGPERVCLEVFLERRRRRCDDAKETQSGKTVWIEFRRFGTRVVVTTVRSHSNGCWNSKSAMDA